MLIRYLVFLALVATVIGCESSSDKAELPMSLMMPAIGTRVANEISIGDKKIPLPEGDWTVIGTGIDRNNAEGYFVSEMLVQIRDKTVTGAVEIFSNLPVKGGNPEGFFGAVDSSPQGWLTHRSCTRDDMHFLKVYSNIRRGEQDCWWINHWRMNRTGVAVTEHWMEAVKYLSDNDISAPLDMLGVSFRLANKMYYLTANYFFNAEVEGLKSTDDLHWSINTWETSDWHPDKVRNDGKKREFIVKLIAWGNRWHGRIRESFGAE